MVFRDSNLPSDWNIIGDADLTLKSDSPAIDAGAVIPSINDNYLGDAPDLGAYEFGSPTIPYYGPRLNVPPQVDDCREDNFYFDLRQNYPNPFNPETEIEYALPKDSEVKLIIYNLLGQRVQTLVESKQVAGFHRVRWDGRDYSGKEVTSGIYFYQLKAGNFIFTRKMVLLH